MLFRCEKSIALQERRGSITHAIEFDFEINWTEAVGQRSYYSIQTYKKAGIVLILESIKDRKFWIRLNTTLEHFNLPIDVWCVGSTALRK